uniref:Uncharacterized protein n=1 Tax=Magallana gigas TaxID=29159 RepID=K1PML8_MAGGI
MEGMGLTSSVHLMEMAVIICLATTSVWSAAWVCCCCPKPVGMSFSVEILAEHPDVVHLQRIYLFTA